LICGELGLDGSVKVPRGIPIIAKLTTEKKITSLIIPAGSIIPSAAATPCPVYTVNSLNDCLAIIKDSKRTSDHQEHTFDHFSKSQHRSHSILPSIFGNTAEIRALCIAAAGRHHIALLGAPGTGKSLLAQALPELLPPLSPKEYAALAEIYSLDRKAPPTCPPLRKPHHSASRTTILGGGIVPIPGEISKAHGGVLFVDEFPDFSKEVLLALRSVLDNKEITLSQRHISASFPAEFILVAAMNLCPCGYYKHPAKQCSCTPFHIQRYQKRIPGPLWDRIDIVQHVHPAAYDSLAIQQKTTLSAIAHMQNAIQISRKRQEERGFHNNSLTLFQANTIVALSPSARNLLRRAHSSLGLSTRNLLQSTGVAQTIADLEEKDCVTENHVAEALSYRRRLD